MVLLAKLLEALGDDKAGTTAHKTAINKILEYLVALLPHHGITAAARDGAIAAVVKNAKLADVGKRFVDLGGVRAMLMVASCSQSPLFESKRETGIAVTPETRMQVSVAISHLWDATAVKTPTFGVP